MRPVVVSVAVLAAFVAVAGGAAPAWAADPRIQALDPEETVPGGVVKIRGGGFSDVAEDVEVTMGGAEAVVLAAGPEEITVFVPQTLKRGKHEVFVKVGTSKSKGATISIVDGKEAMDEQREKDRQANEVGGTVEEVLQTRFLELDRPRAEVDRGSLLVTVSGNARYPDECIIFLKLKHENRLIASAQATVLSSRFQAQFGPFKRRLFAGNYAVEAEFNLYNQPGDIRRMFRASFPDAAERAVREKAQTREYVRIGTPDEEKYQLSELRDHFRKTLERAGALLDDLERNFCVTGRSIYRKDDGSVQETEWEAWLGRKSLRGLPESEQKKRAEKLAKEKGFLKNGYFDDAAWREWIDFKWRGEVLELAKKHAEYRDTWEVIKFHDPVLQLEELLSMLLKISQRRSSELYEANALPIAQPDKELSGGDVLRLGTGGASPAGFRALLGKIEREVGLEGER